MQLSYIMKAILFLPLTLLLIACSQKPDYSNIQKTLEKVYEEDQMYRSSNNFSSQQQEFDLKNTKIVAKIIDSLGWLSEKEIGHKANIALFMTIQHAPSLEIMEKYLPILKAASEAGKANKKQYAYLYDRVETLNNRPQLYGTQFNIDNKGNIVFKDIKDSASINERRKNMNMEPLEVYIKNATRDN